MKIMEKPVTIIRLLTVMFFLTAAISCTEQPDPSVQFRFRQDHTFRIAQFTDVHWDNNSPNILRTDSTIRFILQTEKPDLAILTGDIVTSSPAREGWLAIAKIFEQEKTPWAVTLGNHDSETGIGRDEIFELLSPLPFFEGNSGTEMTGAGNYRIPVSSADGKKTAAVIYCLDSNSSPADRKTGHYDWIHFDQIDWYRKTSDQYTTSNNGASVPSVMFFHIPIPEFQHAAASETTVGFKNEGVSSSGINSGLFASLVEKKDVMGVFVGHDHNDDYIGINHDIALAFGQVTGADAYGDFDRGSRIIELHEGEFSFDTWIRTRKGITFRYSYPAGLQPDDTTAEYLPAREVTGLKPGIRYDYFEGRVSSVAGIGASSPIKTGILANILLEPAAVKDSFSLVFSGWLSIPKKAVYRFYTYSDDGSALFIDGKLIVDNDGSHSGRRANGKIGLDEGFHEFRLLYFEDYMGNELDAGIASINIREGKIPDNMLWTKEQ
jgi:hypothetical protein